MGNPNTWAAAGTAMYQGGGVLDQVNDQIRKDREKESYGDKGNAALDNILMRMVLQRQEKIRQEDEKKQADWHKQSLENAGKRANSGMEASQTAFNTFVGSDAGNLQQTSEGSSAGARRVYDPADPKSQTAYRAQLAQSELSGIDQDYGGTTSTEVRSLLSDNGTLGTPEGQNVFNSFYKPERDAAVIDARRKAQAERLAASAARQRVALSNRNGGAGFNVPILEQMLSDAHDNLDGILAASSDDYKIGMDKIQDQRVAVAKQNVTTLQAMLNKAKATGAGGQQTPSSSSANPLGLTIN